MSTGLTLTTEAFIPPGSYGDATVLALIDVGFNGFTQNRLGSIQGAQVKHAVFEVFLNRSYVILTRVSRSSVTYCASVFTTYIGIDFGMAYGERTVPVQNHAAVARALILLFLSALRVSGVGLFVASVNTDNGLDSHSVAVSCHGFNI